MRWNVYVLALILVVMFGAALRTYDIANVPTELVADELDLYNSAQSIATTGHDIDGTLLPFFSCSFTRNPPVYAIAAYSSSLVFGKTPFGLRFPAILFGLIAIVLVYAIALELTRRRDIALVAALVQAIAPLFVHFSRVAWEPASELPFVLGGVYLLLRAFRSRDDARTEDPPALKPLLFGAFLLGLAAYTYMAGWFYAVVLGGAIIAFNARCLRHMRARVAVAAAIAVWGIVSSAALWMWHADWQSDERTRRIATFNGGLTPDALHTFASNYLTHFYWSYLVTTGDPQPATTWRYLAGFGALYWWVVPLAAIGLVFAYRYVRERWRLAWVLFWFAVYPLGGALTNEAVPSAPRTLAGAPVFCILAAFGFATLLDFASSFKHSRPRRFATFIVRAFLVVNAAISVALFSAFYFTRYVHVYSNAWDSGTSAMFAAVRSRYPEDARVCFSVRPAWYAIDTYTRYYLGGLGLQTIENIGDPACSLPGTVLVTDSDHPVSRSGFATRSKILDVDGSGFAFIYERPPLQHTASK